MFANVCWKFTNIVGFRLKFAKLFGAALFMVFRLDSKGQKHANLVGIDKSCEKHICLQKSASIAIRANPPKCAEILLLLQNVSQIAIFFVALRSSEVTDLKTELSQLRVAKVTGGAAP